jgi:hypothetical protein
MKVTLENTSKIVDLVVNGATVKARIWEGETSSGIKVHAYITRIAVGKDDDASEFERELQEQRVPSAEIQAFPLKMIL